MRSGRGVAAPGGVELLDPIWSCSSSVALLEGANRLANAIAQAARQRDKLVDGTAQNTTERYTVVQNCPFPRVVRRFQDTKAPRGPARAVEASTSVAVKRCLQCETVPVHRHMCFRSGVYGVARCTTGSGKARRCRSLTSASWPASEGLPRCAGRLCRGQPCLRIDCA